MGKAGKNDPTTVDPESDAELLRELEKLTPEQQEMFMRALELVAKKRRIMLLGYLTALVALITGLLWAVYAYATKESGEFTGWVFLVPFATAALAFIVFGKFAKAITK